MIRDLLEYTRASVGEFPHSPVPMDLHRVCNAAVDELRVVHPDRTIVCDVAGNVEGTWDPDRLQQVVSNLVGNALEHSDGVVSVRVEAAKHDVVLSVHNDGEPIPAEVLPALFEPFRRGERSAGGLGLGLYIVREVIRRHGERSTYALPPQRARPSCRAGRACRRRRRRSGSARPARRLPVKSDGAVATVVSGRRRPSEPGGAGDRPCELRAARNVFTSIGFGRKASMPVGRLDSDMSTALSKMTGISRSVRLFHRLRQNAQPSMIGIIRSRRMNVGAVCIVVSTLSASSPCRAPTAANPASSRRSQSASLIPSSSSTTRTKGRVASPSAISASFRLHS